MDADHVSRFSSYTAAQLKTWLQRLGRKTSGSKSELIFRLLSIPENERGEFQPDSNKTSHAETQPKEGQATTSTATADAEGDESFFVLDEGNADKGSVYETYTPDEPPNDGQPNEKSEKDRSTKERTENGQTNESEKHDEENENDERNPPQMNEIQGEKTQTRDGDGEKELLLMKWENKILKREVELKRKENMLLKKCNDDLRRENAKLGQTTKNDYLNNGVKELLAEFEGDCFSHWETQARNLIDVYNLNDKNAKILISCRLKGNALRWFHSRSDLIQMSSDQVLLEMKKMFSIKESRTTQKRVYEERKWQPAETFYNYLHEKVILANKLDLEEEEILEDLIEGIPNAQLKSQARMQRFNEIGQLAEAFSKIELPKPKSTINAIATPSTSTFRRRGAITEGPEPKTVIRCYNCNSQGHLASECRKAKRPVGACHICAKMGHYAATCPERKTVAVHHFNQHEQESDDDY